MFLALPATPPAQPQLPPRVTEAPVPDVPARRAPGDPAGERGQATTEYALVLLGAAAVALLLVAWATRTGAFGTLLDAVMDSIKRKI